MQSLHPRLPILAAFISLGCLSGCVTLDHSDDLERAATLVGERVGDLWPERSAEPGGWSRSGWDGLEWDGTSPLDADHAVRIALVHNQSIRGALERIAMARADLVQAGLLPNPVLSVGLGFPIDGAGGPVTIGAGLTQQLVALWLRDDRIRESDLALEREILAVSHEALALVRDVRQAHARVVYSERDRELLRDDEALLDRLVRLVDARREAGEASLVDVNRVGFQRRMLHLAGIDAQRQTAQHRLAVLALMGRVDAPLTWVAVDASRQKMRIPEEASIGEIVQTQRLDVLAASARAEMLAIGAGLERRQRVGGVDVGAQFDRDDDGRQHLGPAVALEIPIFDTKDAAVARAAAAHRQAAHVANAVRDQAILEARTVVNDLQRLEELRAWIELELLPGAETQLELVQRVIDAGEVDATALIESQRDRIQARRRLNGIQLESRLRWLDLEHALGGRTTE